MGSIFGGDIGGTGNFNVSKEVDSIDGETGATISVPDCIVLSNGQTVAKVTKMFRYIARL